MLAKADTGFVIWYRAQKNNVDIKKAFNQAIENYRNFLLSIKKQIIVISTLLPIIDDNSVGEVVNFKI